MRLSGSARSLDCVFSSEISYPRYESSELANSSGCPVARASAVALRRLMIVRALLRGTINGTALSWTGGRQRVVLLV